MRIILLGPPASGKTTQAKKLARHFSLPRISPGKIFRKNIKQGTDLGKFAAEYTQKGELLPSQVTLHVIAAQISKLDAARGFILDGFPRTVDQAVELQEFLASHDAVEFDPHNPTQGIDAIIHFAISRERELEKLHHRGRIDDTADIIHTRLHIYDTETTPLLAYYGSAIKELNTQGSKEEIFNRLIHLLEPKQN